MISRVFLNIGQLILTMMATQVIAAEVINRSLDGFKELKFGMTTGQIEERGFVCEGKSKWFCSRRIVNELPLYEATFLGRSLDALPKITLESLGLKEHFLPIDFDRVMPFFENGALVRIQIIAPFDQQTVNHALSSELGEPFIYPLGEAHEREWRSWVYSNGALLTTSPHPTMPGNSYVSYVSPELAVSRWTKELLFWNLKNFIPSKNLKDF